MVSLQLFQQFESLELPLLLKLFFKQYEELLQLVQQFFLLGQSFQQYFGQLLELREVHLQFFKLL